MMTPHDTLYGGQPQPTPGELGRKERIENAGLGFRIHAGAGIGDFQADVAARVELLGLEQFFGASSVEFFNTGADVHRPFAFADGLGCVDNQVHDQLLDLPAVAFHGRRLSSRRRSRRTFLGRETWISPTI